MGKANRKKIITLPQVNQEPKESKKEYKFYIHPHPSPETNKAMQNFNQLKTVHRENHAILIRHKSESIELPSI
jgi:hypothetical protein